VYLNVDLEIRSRSDLTPLVQALQHRLFVLHSGRVHGMFVASFETAGLSHPPDAAIHHLAAALRRVPPSVQRLWRQARDRVFDIGVAKAAGPMPFSLTLRQDTVRIVTALNARLALTFYPSISNAPKKLAKKPLERAAMNPSRPGKRVGGGARRRAVGPSGPDLARVARVGVRG